MGKPTSTGDEAAEQERSWGFHKAWFSEGGTARRHLPSPPHPGSLGRMTPQGTLLEAQDGSAMPRGQLLDQPSRTEDSQSLATGALRREREGAQAVKRAPDHELWELAQSHHPWWRETVPGAPVFAQPQTSGKLRMEHASGFQ